MVRKCGPDPVAFLTSLCIVDLMLHLSVEFLEQVFWKVIVSSY